MPRRGADSITKIPDDFFANELAGETPPSFSTMQELYRLAVQIFALRPWHILNESELVLIRDVATGETCYISVMGALGEALVVQAYVGAEAYRLFRRVEAAEISGAGDFYAAQRSVQLEFVPRAELTLPDRNLLKAMDHPFRVGQRAPNFRACRPGFFPWYVTEREACLLQDCLRAVITACAAVTAGAGKKYWQQRYTYPMISPGISPGIASNGEPGSGFELVEAILPQEPALEPAALAPERLIKLRDRGQAPGGVLELDHFSSGATIGKKNERKGCVSVALAVDSRNGFLFPPEMGAPGVRVADTLGMAIIHAAETRRALPVEVRVLNRRFKDCLQPIAQLCGFPINIVRSLPALAEAREGLLRMLSGGGAPLGF